MKINYPHSTKGEFNYGASTKKKFFGMRWPSVIAMVPAIAADLFAFVYLLQKSDGMRYAIFPLILLVLNTVFAVMSVFTDYRFKYGVIPVSAYTGASALTIIIFLAITIANLNVTMSTLAYVIFIVSHFVTYGAILLLAFKANRNTKGAKKTAVSGILAVMLISAVSIAYCALFGFFGQNIGIFDEEMVLVYNYDKESDTYEVQDVLYGRGTTVYVPESFNGKEVKGVSCNVLTKNVIKSVTLSNKGSFVFTDTELLSSEVEYCSTIIASQDKAEGYRQQFYDYAVSHPNKQGALLMCNSVSVDLPEDKVAVYLKYDYTNFPSVAQDKLAPIIILDKGDEFKFEDYATDVDYFHYIAPKDTNDLATAYTEGNGYFLNTPVSEELGAAVEGSKINSSIHVILSFERVYLVDLGEDNDDVYVIDEKHPDLTGTSANGQSFDGKFVCDSELGEYIAALPTRKGMSVVYALGVDKYSVAGGTLTADVLRNYLSEGSGTLVPEWSVNTPVINSVTLNKPSFVYGDDAVEFTVSVNSELDFFYNIYIGSKTEASDIWDASYTKVNPIPADSGVYTVEVIVKDASTSLTNTTQVKKDVDVQIIKKAVNVDWTLPDGETYSSYEHPATITIDQALAVRTDVLSVDRILKDLDNASELLSTQPVNAGRYQVEAYFTDDTLNDYYVIANKTQDFSINKLAANLNWSANSYVYNGTNQKPTVTVTGVSGTIASTVLDQISKDAGSYVAEVKLDNPIDERNYSYTSTYDFTITPKPIKPTWDKDTFVYNANSQHPVITGYEASAGLCAGDTIAATEIEYKDFGKFANTYTVVASFKSSVINYTLSDDSKTYTITKAPLSIVVNSTSKVYDGLVCGKYDMDVTGLQGADTLDKILTLNYGPAHTAINAATYDINPTYEEYDGLDSVYSSYTVSLSEESGEAKLTINKRQITLQALSQNKTYDGYVFVFNPNTHLTVPKAGTQIASTDKLEEIVKVFKYGDAETAVNAGSHSIELSVATQGAKYGNYDITFDDATSELVIDKKELTITVNNGQKVYDGTVYNDFSYEYTDLADTDIIDDIVSAINYGTAASQVNASTYDIRPNITNGTKYNNYDVSVVNGKLTISKRDITFKPDAANKTYDGKIFPTLDFVVRVSAGSLAGGQSISDVISVFGYGDAQSGINAKTYTITLSAATKGDEYDNYNIKYATDLLTIAKREITFKVDNASKTYDGSKYTGFVVTIESGTIADTDTQSQIISAFKYGAAESAIDAGSYDITLDTKTQGSKYANYDITYVDGTLDIAKKAISFTISPINKTYKGSKFSNIDLFATVSIDGLASKDTALKNAANFTYGEAETAIDAGQYTITLKVKDAATFKNYEYADVLASTTLDINKATASASWGTTSFTYDNREHKPSVTVTGVNGTLSVTVNVDREAIDVGSYTASIVFNSQDSVNYNPISAKAFTITKRTITVTADNKNATYDADIYDGGFTQSASGLASGDSLSDVVASFNYGAAASAIDRGEYTITLTVNSQGTKYDNYSITLKTGKLTINQATAKVTWGNTSFTYDGTAQAPTATVTGVGGVALNSTVSGAKTTAGTHSATVALTNSDDINNYRLDKPMCSFVIEKAIATVEWTNTEFTYDGMTHTPTAVVKGIGGTELSAVVSGGSRNVGNSYKANVTLNSTDAANYEIANPEISFAIKAISLKIVIEDLTVSVSELSDLDFTVSCTGAIDDLSTIFKYYTFKYTDKLSGEDVNYPTKAGTYTVELIITSSNVGSNYYNYIPMYTKGTLTVTEDTVSE